MRWIMGSFRATSILTGFFAMTVPLMPVQAALLRVSPKGARRFPHWYHRQVCRLIGVRLAVEGSLAQGRPVLLVCNHTSWLDIPVLSAVAPVAFVAKKEVARWPFVSWLAKLQRTVFVDRARRKSLRDVREMCSRELARVDYDSLRAREIRNRQKRFVSFKDMGGGLVSMHGLLDAETAGPLRAYVEPEVQRQLSLQRDLITQGELGESERREVGQVYADVLADMARHMSGCVEPADGIKTALVVRVSLEDLERGVGLAECDTVSGPITIECLRAMAVDVGAVSVKATTGEGMGFAGRSEGAAAHAVCLLVPRG